MRHPVLLSCCLALLSGCAGAPLPLAPEAAARAQVQQEAIAHLRQGAPAAPLDAADAAALALNNNLNLRLAALQRLIADAQVDIADLQKLPKLLIQAGYSRRSHLEIGETDSRVRKTASHELAWDTLGFATAWLRAEAASDQTLLTALNGRDETNRVLLETRLAWQSVAHQQAREEIVAAADGSIRQAVALIERLQNTTLMDPHILALRENELWQQQSRLRQARLEAKSSRWRLASLLAVADGEALQVAGYGADSRAGEVELMHRLLALPQESLEREALARRTELLKTDVQVRLLRQEARYAWLTALPGLTFKRGHYRDSDTPREPMWWNEGSYNLAFNLFSLLSAFAQHREVKLQQSQLQLRQLALAVGVVEQVRIAREKLETQLALWQDARNRLQLAESRFKLWQSRKPFNPDDEFNRALAAAAYADARISGDQAYEACLKSGWELMQAVGLDFAPPAGEEGAAGNSTRLRQWWAALPSQLAEIPTLEKMP